MDRRKSRQAGVAGAMIEDVGQSRLIIASIRPVDASAPCLGDHAAAERARSIAWQPVLGDDANAPLVARRIGTLIERLQLGARRTRIGDDQRDADAGEQDWDPDLHRDFRWQACV